jgi:radical SAM protein with 4Fe4S-binding SPASM domain
MLAEGNIKQCSIVLTRGCNLRCNFCYVKSAGYEENDKIEYGALKSIVDFCCEAKVKYIFFTGGEPLTYSRFPEILQYIKTRSHPMTTAVATNGVLLKEMDMCRTLINSGLGYIDVSMKGNGQQEWVETTGYNGFEAQQHAIRNLASLPIDFTCSMVITPENVKTFCETVQISHNNGARQFSFTFVIDNDDAIEKDLDYLQKHDPIKLVSDFVSQIDKLNTITDDWWIEYSFPLCVYTEEQLSLLKGRLATPCQIHLKNAITFNTKMELLPCDMYIFQKLGLFGRDFSSFQEFLKLTESTDYSKAMEVIQKSPSSECAVCNLFDECYGGCPVLWKNYSFTALKEFKAKKLLDSSFMEEL